MRSNVAGNFGGFPLKFGLVSYNDPWSRDLFKKSVNISVKNSLFGWYNKRFFECPMFETPLISTKIGKNMQQYGPVGKTPLGTWRKPQLRGWTLESLFQTGCTFKMICIQKRYIPKNGTLPLLTKKVPKNGTLPLLTGSPSRLCFFSFFAGSLLLWAWPWSRWSRDAFGKEIVSYSQEIKHHGPAWYVHLPRIP